MVKQVIQEHRQRTSTSLVQHPTVTLDKHTVLQYQVLSSNAACTPQQLPSGTVTQLLCLARSPRTSTRLWHARDLGLPGKRFAHSRSLMAGPGGSDGSEFRPAWLEASSTRYQLTVCPSSGRVPIRQHRSHPVCSTTCRVSFNVLPRHAHRHALRGSWRLSRLPHVAVSCRLQNSQTTWDSCTLHLSGSFGAGSALNVNFVTVYIRCHGVRAVGVLFRPSLGLACLGQHLPQHVYHRMYTAQLQQHGISSSLTMLTS